MQQARETLPPEGRKALRIGLLSAVLELSRLDCGKSAAETGIAIFHDSIVSAIREAFREGGSS